MPNQINPKLKPYLNLNKLDQWKVLLKTARASEQNNPHHALMKTWPGTEFVVNTAQHLSLMAEAA